MIEIIFQYIEDAKKLKKLMCHKLYHLEWKIKDVQKENEHILIIDWDKSANVYKSLDKLKKVFYQFIFQYKCDGWAKGIIENQYLFKDETEQRHILEITHSLIEGEREELANLVPNVNMEACLKDAIAEMLKEDVSFSFDSFVTFRLQRFMELLKNYIEISIDEYKLEQEYQVFIHTLRDFLSKRSPKKQTIHLLVDLEIQFYDEKYQEITQQDLLMIIDKKLFTHSSVYIDPFSIGPLLSLAPNKVYLYTEDREQPIVRTIVNIFEERVHILEKEDFFQGIGILSQRFE